jgi:hypothetical protein
VVVGGVSTRPEEVAERVDAVCDVVQHEDADRSAPEQAREPGDHAVADRDAETECCCQPPDCPDQERAVHCPHDRVGEQVGRVSVAGGALGVVE